MKPSQHYEALLLQPGFLRDPAQQQAVARLDQLYEQLINIKPTRGWREWFGLRYTPPIIPGLYFWGGVGRGKTMLMDLLFQSLSPAVAAERIHFHGFMNRVHAQLQQKQDQEQPLQAIARDIASATRLLCLDEFVIIDIGDAMIVAGLLAALFDAGVVLVTTSNAAPKGLYRDGLQRARFLPAIDLLERHCQVVELDAGQDYRLRFLQQTDLYSVPHDAVVEARIQDYLQQRLTAAQVETRELVINGRPLALQYLAGDCVWFGFYELCETNRSQRDYLELARSFNTLIVTDIRQMGSADDDVARRFVLLIDVLYDHRVKLICSAAVGPLQLYIGKRLGFEFERTASRLLEMQSSEYLARAHGQQ